MKKWGFLLFPIVALAVGATGGAGALLIAVRTPAEGGPEVAQAVVLWALQLALNFSWSLLFFGGGYYFAALLCLVLLWLAILAMMAAFAATSRAAAWLQLPYLLWVTFAGYLNYAVWALN